MWPTMSHCQPTTPRSFFRKEIPQIKFHKCENYSSHNALSCSFGTFPTKNPGWRISSKLKQNVNPGSAWGLHPRPLIAKFPESSIAQVEPPSHHLVVTSQTWLTPPPISLGGFDCRSPRAHSLCNWLITITSVFPTTAISETWLAPLPATCLVPRGSQTWEHSCRHTRPYRIIRHTPILIASKYHIFYGAAQVSIQI